jgi:hypothetical protein
VKPAFEAGGDEPPMLLPGAPLAQSSFSEEDGGEEGSALRGWRDGEGGAAGGGADDVWRGSRNGHGEDLSSTAVVHLPRRTSLGAAARTASAATLSTLIRGGALGSLASPLSPQHAQAPAAAEVAAASASASAAPMEGPPQREPLAPWRPAGLGSPSAASPQQRLAATHSRFQLRAEAAQPLAAAQLASRRMASRLDLAL